MVFVDNNTSLIKSLARKSTRVVNKIRRQADSEITRLSRSLPRPTKGSSAPIQKEWPALSLANGEETRPQSKRRGRFSQSDGERLKVVEFGEEVVEKMELGEQRKQEKKLSLGCRKQRRRREVIEEREKERGYL